MFVVTLVLLTGLAVSASDYSLYFPSFGGSSPRIIISRLTRLDGMFSGLKQNDMDVVQVIHHGVHGLFLRKNTPYS